jgi:hypothetical protein
MAVAATELALALVDPTLTNPQASEHLDAAGQRLRRRAGRTWCEVLCVMAMSQVDTVCGTGHQYPTHDRTAPRTREPGATSTLV